MSASRTICRRSVAVSRLTLWLDIQPPVFRPRDGVVVSTARRPSDLTMIVCPGVSTHSVMIFPPAQFPFGGSVPLTTVTARAFHAPITRFAQ